MAQWVGEGALGDFGGRQCRGNFGAVRISRRRFRSIIETVEQHGSGSGASLGNPAIGRLGLGAHLGAELDKPGLRSPHRRRAAGRLSSGTGASSAGAARRASR